MSTLAMLPLRERGVQNTIEFVLSVHPSNSRYDASAGGGKGSGMSHEALNAASRLLSVAPNGVPQERWFSSIAPQIFSLLQGDGEPEMDRAAAFIIGFGILGRKQYGAPGMPGWKAFVEPMLRCIDPSVVPTSDEWISSTEEPIITLGTFRVLIPSVEVAKSLRRLVALVTSHPHPSLTRRLLRPVLLPLWSLSHWPEDNEQIDIRYRKPARKLLRIFLQLSSSSQSSDKSEQHSVPTNLLVIIQNLMFNGRPEPSKPQWIYATSGDGGLQIQERSHSKDHQLPDLAAIDGAADSFIDLIKSTPDLQAEISNLFMSLCKKWLADGGKGTSPSILTHVESTEPKDDTENRLVEAKILQKMMTDLPEKLVSDSRQVLDLVDQVFSQFNSADEGGNEDIVAIALSLLNIVFTSPSFRETPEIKPILTNIQSLLERISKKSHLEISSTARNMLMLMRFRNAIEEPNNSTSHQQDQQAEDRKSYNLAMSYLTATDSPPPVRVQGLELISNLIRASSAIIDIPALLVLFSSLLQDSDEYIYLRAIKSFIQLSEKHPKAVLRDLIDRYADPNEEYELDQRLRLGEALLQVIEGSSRAFSGEIASTVSHGLLSIAGRRGLRPKTEQAREKRNRLKRKKDKEAEDAWDGEVPQLDELLENEAQEDHEIMSQILSGWESKRGTEDVRIRASAVSIMATAIESNVTGIGSNLISMTVDLSIHILTLEPEPEKGILRRSAILLIMNFVRALDSARAEGRKLGFGFVGQSLDDVQRILKYVEDTDNDGLVRQHARDVLESLQNWQMNALLPSHNNQMDIQELAGLSINPGDSSNSRMRSRIEEIE